MKTISHWLRKINAKFNKCVKNITLYPQAQFWMSKLHNILWKKKKLLKQSEQKNEFDSLRETIIINMEVIRFTAKGQIAINVLHVNYYLTKHLSTGEISQDILLI